MAAKKRTKNVKLATAPWDMGADGPANRHGLVVESRGDSNAVKGVRRVDMLEFWHRRGTIGTAGYNAAVKLRNAYEATLRGRGWPDNERVQSSPKPDIAIAMQLDRLSAFVALSKHIDPRDRAIIDVCVLCGGSPADAGYVGEQYKDGLAALRCALNRLANKLA